MATVRARVAALEKQVGMGADLPGRTYFLIGGDGGCQNGVRFLQANGYEVADSDLVVTVCALTGENAAYVPPDGPMVPLGFLGGFSPPDSWKAAA